VTFGRIATDAFRTVTFTRRLGARVGADAVIRCSEVCDSALNSPKPTYISARRSPALSLRGRGEHIDLAPLGAEAWGVGRSDRALHARGRERGRITLAGQRVEARSRRSSGSTTGPRDREVTRRTRCAANLHAGTFDGVCLSPELSRTAVESRQASQTDGRLRGPARRAHRAYRSLAHTASPTPAVMA